MYPMSIEFHTTVVGLGIWSNSWRARWVSPFRHNSLRRYRMVRGWGCLVLVSLVFGYVFSGSGIDGNDDDIVLLCKGYFITVMEW